MLRCEDPEHFQKFEDSIKILLTKGLSGAKFWYLFVQCIECNYVILVHHLPYCYDYVTSVHKKFKLFAYRYTYSSTEVQTTVLREDSNLDIEED